MLAELNNLHATGHAAQDAEALEHTSVHLGVGLHAAEGKVVCDA